MKGRRGAELGFCVDSDRQLGEGTIPYGVLPLHDLSPAVRGLCLMVLLTVYPGATCIFFGLAGPTRKRFSRVENFLMCSGEIISDLGARYKSTP